MFEPKAPEYGQGDSPPSSTDALSTRTEWVYTGPRYGGGCAGCLTDGDAPVDSQATLAQMRVFCEAYGCVPSSTLLSDFWDFVSSEEFVGFLKDLGVSALAVAGGALICGTSAGVGCVMIAAGAVGAATNVGAEELMDCMYRECDGISASELIGEGAEGFFLGATTGFLNFRAARAFGAERLTIGVISSLSNYGAAATGNMLVEQLVPRILAWFTKQYSDFPPPSDEESDV